MRTFFLMLIIAVAPRAWAELEVPKFNHGGVILAIQYGGGVWNLDRANLNRQVLFLGGLYADHAQNTHALGIRLVYNIKGHASAGIDISATGWDVANNNRAGAGFVVGLVAWHPLELLYYLLEKPERPTLGLDVATHIGLGYGISGGGSPALGMDGFIVQWGLNIDYFFTRWFALGFFTRCNFLRWGTFYTDWDGAHSNPPYPGSSASLNPPAGGTWWQVGAAIVLRFGD